MNPPQTRHWLWGLYLCALVLVAARMSIVTFVLVPIVVTLIAAEIDRSGGIFARWIVCQAARLLPDERGEDQAKEWTDHILAAGEHGMRPVLSALHIALTAPRMAWLDRHEPSHELSAPQADRWRTTQGVGFKELGYAADEISYGLQNLLGGDVDRWGGRQAIGSAACCVERAMEYRDALIALAPEDHLGRLDMLLADSPWVAAAVEAIDEIKHTHRQQLARWAPVLLTGELARILNEVAELNERVFELQAPLRRLRDRPPTDADFVSNEDVHEARRRWQRVLFEAVLLQKRLMRVVLGPRWQHAAGRRRLTQDQVAQLNSTHAERGPIKPPRGVPRSHSPDVGVGAA